jgi:hypothetical protein
MAKEKALASQMKFTECLPCQRTYFQHFWTVPPFGRPGWPFGAIARNTA